MDRKIGGSGADGAADALLAERFEAQRAIRARVKHFLVPILVTAVAVLTVVIAVKLAFRPGS